MSDNNKLRTCSRCHSTKLESYFGINKKGELYKLCDNCRNKANAATKKHFEEAQAVLTNNRIILKNKLNIFKRLLKSSFILNLKKNSFLFWNVSLICEIQV